MSVDLLSKNIYQLKLLDIIDDSNYLTIFGLWCVYNDVNFMDVILLLFGASVR